jgi:hypothetical protein
VLFVCAVVTMGCADACPIYPGKRYEDREVGDPPETRRLLAELTQGVAAAS